MNKEEESNNNFSTLAIGMAMAGAFFLPFVTAYSNILTSKMKNLHENTISCYLNPSVGLFAVLIMLAKWEFAEFVNIVY